MGHFGVAKTLDTLHEHFFWSHLRKFVNSFYDKCITCRKAKSKVQPHGLYTHLPIPTMPWVDIVRIDGLNKRRGVNCFIKDFRKHLLQNESLTNNSDKRLRMAIKQSNRLRK